MTGFRPPIVAGVSGGVGTSTLALALHGRDADSATADADVLVCRSAAESLDRACRIADLAELGRYPVLAVLLDSTERRPPTRLTQLDGRWALVVPLPHVARWREVRDPYREAAGLLGAPRENLPRGLRVYAEAVARLAGAVADSGRLSTGAPAAPFTAPFTAQFTPPFTAQFTPPPTALTTAPALAFTPAPPAADLPPEHQVAPLHPAEPPRPVFGDPALALVPSPLREEPTFVPFVPTTPQSTMVPTADRGGAVLPELRPVRGIRVLG